MKLKMILLYTIIGVLIGELVLYPLFIIAGHAMFEQHVDHGHTFYELIASDIWIAFSSNMLPWSIVFAVIGALLANHIGYILHIYRKVRHLSSRDELTSMLNRHHFEEELDRTWKQAIRDAKPLSLILCDIDNFKSYNALYGHQKGDRSLQIIANGLKETLQRPLDTIARYSGEVFVIILPDTRLDGASYVAQQLRDKVEALNIVHESSEVANVVTMSFGVATVLPNDNLNPGTLILAAHKALTQAKDEGRNRIIVDG